MAKEGKDNLGIAIAFASLNNKILNMDSKTYSNCETAIELTYNYQLTEHLCIQPDVQYILNPGMKRQYDNALIGMLRVNWNYN